jgi:hypothetical protein
MKKVFLLMSLLLITVVSASAKKQYVTLQSGNPTVLNQVGKTATFSFDYKNTICEGKPLSEYLKNRGEENVRDWPKECEETENGYFMERWNDESEKNIKLVKSGSADYKVIVHIDQLDLGNTAVAMFVPSFSRKTGACEVSGTVDIIDAKTGRNVCTLAISRLRGVSGRAFDVASSETRRRGLTYKKMAELILEFAQAQK